MEDLIDSIYVLIHKINTELENVINNISSINDISLVEELEVKINELKFCVSDLKDINDNIFENTNIEIPKPKIIEGIENKKYEYIKSE